MKKINFPFYIIMGSGFLLMLALSIMELIHCNFRPLLTDSVGAVLFVNVLLYKLCIDYKLGKFVKFINIFLLVFVLISIIVEGGFLFK